MWIGVVKVMLDPEIEAICFTSAVGRSSRENHCPALPGVVGYWFAAKSSVPVRAGLCFCQTTRKSGEAQMCTRPAGSVCQPAPEAASSNTIWPGEKPAVLATVTVYAPLAASTVRLVEAATPLPSLVLEYRAGPTMMSGEGLGPTFSLSGLAPSVFCSVVWPGPAPRKVMPLLIST